MICYTTLNTKYPTLSNTSEYCQHIRLLGQWSLYVKWSSAAEAVMQIHKRGGGWLVMIQTQLQSSMSNFNPLVYEWCQTCILSHIWVAWQTINIIPKRLKDFIKQSYYASTIILVNNIIQFHTVGNVIYLDSLDTFTELDCYTSLLGGTIILQINLSAATVGYRVKYTASGKVTKSLVALCLRANNQ